MNILILSAGRRTQLVDYFLEEFEGIGKIIVGDSDLLAPTMYTGNRGYIIPSIYETTYLEVIKEICQKENIKGILSLIDPELSILSYHHKELEKIGVTCILSKKDVVEVCFDKYYMYEFLRENHFPTAMTYLSIEDIEAAMGRNEIQFPLIVKPRKGSASNGVQKVESLYELKWILEQGEFIIQDFLKGMELGVDVYVDILTGKVTDIFAKEKIRMRAGETDKSRSVIDVQLFTLVEQVVQKLGLIGPIDLDVFQVDGKYYISEINPRFGGGYPHAHVCGINFPRNIRRNLEGIINEVQIGQYEPNVYVMKSDQVLIKTEKELYTTTISYKEERV